MSLAELTGTSVSGARHHTREAVLAQSEPRRRRWSGGALFAARRWLLLPLALGLLGLVGGLAAGMAARPSAQTLLLVQTGASDGAGIDLAVKSTALELNTVALYADATRSLRVDAQDLRRRTQIAATPDSQIVSVTVTAPSTEQAAREANALAESAIALNQQRVAAELEEVTAQTRNLIAGQPLRDADAEQARVERLGDSLGSTQSNLIVGTRHITLLQSAEDSRLVPSPVLLGSMGLFAGTLLGLAGAVWLGSRRVTVRSAKDVRDLYPALPVIEPGDLDSVFMVDPPGGTVFVGGLQPKSSAVLEVSDRVGEILARQGYQVQLLDSVPITRHRAENVLGIVPLAVNRPVLSRIARHADDQLIMVVEPHLTTLERLAEVVADLPDRTYVLVTSATQGWAVD